MRILKYYTEKGVTLCVVPLAVITGDRDGGINMHVAVDVLAANFQDRDS